MRSPCIRFDTVTNRCKGGRAYIGGTEQEPGILALWARILALRFATVRPWPGSLNPAQRAGLQDLAR